MSEHDNQQTDEVYQQPVQTIPAVVDLPDWLMVEQPKTRRTNKEVRALAETTYESFFEVVLDKMVNGDTLKDIVREDARGIDEGKFRTWIMKDALRRTRYEEALEINSYAIEEEMLAIADAMDNPLEDVQRSTLKINTRKWVLGVRNKRRFGDVKKLEIEKSELPADHLSNLADRLTVLQKNARGGYTDPNIVDVE